MLKAFSRPVITDVTNTLYCYDAYLMTNQWPYILVDGFTDLRKLKIDQIYYTISMYGSTMRQSELWTWSSGTVWTLDLVQWDSPNLGPHSLTLNVEPVLKYTTFDCLTGLPYKSLCPNAHSSIYQSIHWFNHPFVHLFVH